MNILLTSSRRFLPSILIVCVAVFFAGCASTKDAKSRNSIANLKALHLAFIDEFTEGAGKTWDDQKLTDRTAAMEAQFSKAEDYEATKKKDARRSKAISILRGQFKRHTGFLERRKAFYRTSFAANLKDQVTQNYDQALRGEDIR